MGTEAVLKAGVLRAFKGVLRAFKGDINRSNGVSCMSWMEIPIYRLKKGTTSADVAAQNEGAPPQTAKYRGDAPNVEISIG